MNVDALIGTKDATAYQRKMVEVTRNLQRQLVEQAEKDGYGPMAFTASHVHPLRDKDSGRWPMFLASLLVQEPSKAHRTNEELLREVAEDMGVRPFAKSYMSKPLTKRQKHAVMDILRKHDYPVDERHLKTGTDIRRLVQARTWQGDESAPVNLRIQVASRPGSISIGGTLYKLHPRRGKPKGDPLLDLELNVDKARIPLGAAMKMLGLKHARVAALLRHLPSM